MTYTPASEFKTRPDLLGRFGMVASTHWLASGAAQAVLERGGNAFDAAVAGGFVLHVVEPHLNGPGGDLVGIFAPSGGEPTVLMGQGPAPAGASVEHMRAEGLELVPGAGALAAAVPGAVEAWLMLLRDHGTWELGDILAYAIDYARNGHPILGRTVATIATVADLFRDHWPTSADHWLVDGELPEPDTMVRNEAYASVLERLVAAGEGAATRQARIDAARAAWGSGFVAEAIEEFVRTPHRHASGTDHSGVITAADMAGFSAAYETPVSTSFRGHTIAKAGAWTQGPVLLQILNLLDPLDDALLDPCNPEGAHTILEATKLAFADRDAHYGDGADAQRMAVLLSQEYATSRRALIGDVASREVRPGLDAKELPPLRETYDPAAAAAGVGEPTVSPTGDVRGDTCHIDVADRWGNIIAVTPSGGWLQSSPTIPALGFCLGTRLQMTWLEPGLPSTLQPGRRPRTTLTPTLVLRDGEAVTAVGSPGGDQQDQWQLLYLLRTIVGGFTPQQAIDAPALHSTSFPGSFWPRTWTPAGAVVEDRLGETLIESLRERGHAVEAAGDWSLGRLSAVTRDPATGTLSAAANPRGAQGYAVGR
ncbi:gamma-glutamyltranspeptidase / glutathione hydrolase [Nocardioides sp. YR527]|uniref:gamma-glutamyltransferase family protein n=1 Tax=Nocardioides sp. YR527 TaxID=1881028 RepID=UPI00088CC56B|nr:gamma-glutamyltransferase [Nocardioides sp. YR527]SDJ86318.1 gamma-glutamyltranspeptidase / glutathione hydrolase [Nocardioides sp. YR527]